MARFEGQRAPAEPYPYIELAFGRKTGIFTASRQNPRRVLWLGPDWWRNVIITVSPISQICLLIILLIGFLWMAFASVNIVFKDQLLELKQQ